MMKFAVAFLLAPAALAFAPSPTFMSKTSLSVGKDPNVIFGGNSWRPDSEKVNMGSTDTPDFFPEDYENEVEFTTGMLGSQSMRGGGTNTVQLPGMENLGADAVMMGGIAVNTEIPAGMTFVASSVPDGKLDFQVAGSSSGAQVILEVKPVCMTYEDFYAAFTTDSHPSLSVSPCTGRMDRRGGEMTLLTIKCDPKGQAGTFTGDLVINLPEDNSKICYKITANSY